MNATAGSLDRRPGRLGAVCWLLTAFYFAVEPVVASAWSPRYSFVHETISMLGVTDCVPAADATVCSPWHAWMNGAFVALGVLTGVGAVLLAGRWPRRRLTTVASALVVVGAVSTVATGLFPVDAGVVAHSIASLPQFPARSVGVLLLSVVWWRHDRRAAVVSVSCGVAGLLGLVLFMAATPLGLGIGLMERLAFYPPVLWTAVVGALTVWRLRT